MSTHADPHSNGNPDIRFEESDVSTRPVVGSVLGLAVFTVVFTFIGHLVFHGLAARERANSPEASPLAEQYAAKQPPEPRLQIDPKLDLEVLRAAEDKVLGTYGWVDKAAGVARVPVERAMAMYVATKPAAREAAVPLKMQAKGVAPSQPAEAAGAPDWQCEGGHGGGHAAPAGHAAAPAGHGDAHGSSHGSEAHGH